LLLTGCAGAQPQPTPTTAPPTATATITPSPTPKNIAGKRVLFVIYQQFEEREYGVPYKLLTDKGVIITVASSISAVMMGHLGMEVQPELKLKDAHAADYDAIIFIGGYGYKLYDPEAQRVAQEAVAEGKILAAICVAPITLAKADVINGKRITASTGQNEIKKAGGIFTGKTVERDGLIITGNGPGAATQFGQAIAAALGE
jgi:protease I